MMENRKDLLCEVYIVEDDRDGTIIEKEKTYYKQIVKVDDMGLPHIVKKQIVDQEYYFNDDYIRLKNGGFARKMKYRF